jgi:predicted nucleic acid-binding protein
MATRAGGQIASTAAFWDTSALVPLCVRQSVTPKLQALYKSHEIIVWWATRVEIASALAPLLRMKQISSADYAKARSFADVLSSSWAVVQPSDALRTKAMRLVDQYDLRAADSFQLAAALEWCGDIPKGRTFLSTDDRLREAALLAGFVAPQI